MKFSFLVCLIGVLNASPTFSTDLNYQSRLYNNLRRNLQYESDNFARQGNTDDLNSDYKKYFPVYSMNVAREGKPLSLYQDLRTSLDNEDDYNHSAVNYRNTSPEDKVDQNYPSNAKLPEDDANVDIPQIYDQLNPPESYYHNAMEPSNINMDEYNKYNNAQVQTENRFGYPYGGYGGGGGGGYGYGYGYGGAHAGAGAYGHAGARGSAKLSAGIGFSAGLSAGVDAGAEVGAGAGAGAGAYGYGGGGGGGYGYGYGR